MSRHRRGDILPAGKRVTLLGGSFGSNDGVAEDYGLGLDHLRANLENGLVGIDGERAADGHIVGGHRRGETLPAREGVTLLDRSGLGRDGRAERHINSFVGLPVDTIRELIGVGLEDSGEVDVAVHSESARVVGIAVRPLREVIALGRSGLEGQLRALGAASAPEVDGAAGTGAEIHVEITLNLNDKGVGGIAYATVRFKLKRDAVDRADALSLPVIVFESHGLARLAVAACAQVETFAAVGEREHFGHTTALVTAERSHIIA